MWDGDPVGVDLKRPMWAFAIVSVLCAALMVASAGSGSALLGIFHASKPIASASPLSEPELRDAAPAASTAVVLPPELTAHPVGQRPPGTAQADRTAVSGHQADRPATKTKATKQTTKKAGKSAGKANRKADHQAAKATRKADRKADRKR